MNTNHSRIQGGNLIVILFLLTISITLYFTRLHFAAASPDFFEGMLAGMIGTSISLWFVAAVVIYGRYRKSHDNKQKTQMILAMGMISLMVGLVTMWGIGGELGSTISVFFFLISAVFNVRYLVCLRKEKESHATKNRSM